MRFFLPARFSALIVPQELQSSLDCPASTTRLVPTEKDAQDADVAQSELTSVHDGGSVAQAALRPPSLVELQIESKTSQTPPALPSDYADAHLFSTAISPLRVLTRSRLDAYVRAPGLDQAETSDRRTVRYRIIEAQSKSLWYLCTHRMAVTGTLDLSYCRYLTQLPDGLKVSGNLNLTGCTGLTQLPADLKVGGSLCLAGCSGLIQLPACLKVGRDLNLWGCTGLTQLPVDLRVGGDLYLAYLHGLTQLPAALSVGGDLNLTGCTGLTQLPANLSVSGFCRLNGCTGLTQLPAGLRVAGDFYLRDFAGLTQLPAGLTISGNFCLRDFTGLTQLPNGLRVGGDINLSDFTGLTQLPAGLSVGGNLELIGCSGLTQLPAGLRVSGHLELTGCTSLSQLPADLKVRGPVTTTRCTNLLSGPQPLHMAANSVALQVLHAAEQQLGPRPLHNLYFSREVDTALARFVIAERYQALCVMQLLPFEHFTTLTPVGYVNMFAAGLTALNQVPAQERAQLPDMCAPLARMAEQRGIEFGNLFDQVCRVPAAQRRRRVQELVG